MLAIALRPPRYGAAVYPSQIVEGDPSTYLKKKDERAWKDHLDAGFALP